MKENFELFCAPEVREHLAAWLTLGYTDTHFLGIRKLLGFRDPINKVLQQLGMHDHVTAYFGPLGDEINFVYEGEALKMKFFDSNPENETTKCEIPGIREYNRDFALIENDGKRLKFYEIDYVNFELEPKFTKNIYENGCSYVEDAYTQNMHATFTASKLNDVNVSVTIAATNDQQSRKIINAYTDTVLSILNKENSKAVYKIYENVNKYISHITSNYVVTCKMGDTITDELIVKDGKSKKFTITTTDFKVTLDDNHDWTYTTPLMTVTKKGEDYSFEGSVTEFEIDKIESLKTVKNSVKTFIEANMWFAFE